MFLNDLLVDEVGSQHGSEARLAIILGRIRGTRYTFPMIVGQLQVSEDALRALCEKWRIREIRVFGSVLERSFGPNSDVDLIVEFEERKSPGLFALEELRDELSCVFGGRRIDLCTPRSLHPRLRQSVQPQSLITAVA